jgi:hypothetical protein
MFGPAPPWIFGKLEALKVIPGFYKQALNSRMTHSGKNAVTTYLSILIWFCCELVILNCFGGSIVN